MSGKRGLRRQDPGGWEEAAEEFYQEAFTGRPTTGQTIQSEENENVLPSHLATVGRRKGKATLYYQKHLQSATVGTNETVLPDLSEASHDEIQSWEEIREIRNLPLSIAEKLDLKKKLLHTPTFRVRGVAALRLKRKQWQYSLQNSFNSFLSYFVPWNGLLKRIEGKYGSAHRAFFMFVRWLFFLNLAMSLIVGLLIVLPSELSHLSVDCNSTLSQVKMRTFPDDRVIFPQLRSGNNPVELAVCGNNVTGTSLLATEECWKFYKDNVTNDGDALSVVQDFIQGTGWMELTLAFYGYYKPLVFHWDETASYYNLPIAYILVMLSLAVLCFAAICNTIRRGLRLKAYADSRDFRYMALTFATWNYCVGDKQTAKFKRRVMTQEFKALVLKDRIRQEELSRSSKQNLVLFFVRMLCWTVVLSLLGAACYVIYLTVEFSQWYLSAEGVGDVTFDINNSVILIVSYLPSIVITALNFLAPFAFDALMAFEKYPTEVHINIALFRRTVLRLASLMVLVVTVFSQGYDSAKLCGEHGPKSNGTAILCWETKLGQEIYKLSLFDFAIVFVMTFIVGFIRSRIALRMTDSKCQILQPQTFSVVESSLDLIYNQALCWIGIYFCPVIAWISTIQSFLFFYFYLFRCHINCVQSDHFVSVVKSSSLFLNVLLAVNIISVLTVGYAVAYVPASLSCGPFRGLGFAWEAVVMEVRHLPGATQDFFFFLGTPSFYIILLVICIVVFMYLASVISAQSLVISSMNNQISWLSKDKLFLLRRIEAVGSETLPNRKPAAVSSKRGHTTQ